MKRIITLLASAALVASGLAIVPAAASEPPPTVPAVVNIEDPAGDANYLNGQGFDDTQGDNVTPADLGSLSDILKVWFTSDASTVKTYIQTEAAASGNNVAIFFRVRVDPGVGDPNCLWFQGMTGGLNTPDEAFGSLRDLCGENNETYTEGIEFKIDSGPDDTGIYTISVPRSTHPAFAEGTKLLAPTAHSRNFIGGGGAGATAPQVDDTKPGLDFVVASGGGKDVKKTPPGKNDPPGKKKGCKKGKGKKRGCEGKGKKSPKPGKPKNAGCATFAPGEAGAGKPTVTVTDAATEEKPLEQAVKLDASTADVEGDPTYDFFNVVVDSKAAEAGLYATFEFPTARDYDLDLLHTDGSYAARSHGFNPVGPLYGAPPFQGTEGHGGKTTASSESLVGIKTGDCGGWTIQTANWLGEGGEFTVKLWLGKPEIDPQAPGEEKP